MEVAVVKVIAANKLQSGDFLGEAIYGGLADPIIRLSVHPIIENIGGQGQRTSRATRTLNPEWVPPEEFQFFIIKGQSRIVLSA